MPLTIIQILIMFFASARLTRVITTDSISIPFREWVERTEGTRSEEFISFTTLLNCHWCTGWWIAIFVAGSTWAWGDGQWIWWIWLAASASYVLGIMEDKLGSHA